MVGGFMDHCRTASADAGFSRVAAGPDEVRWLEPRGAFALRAPRRRRAANGFARRAPPPPPPPPPPVSSAGSAVGPAAAHGSGAPAVPPAAEPRLSFDLAGVHEPSLGFAPELAPGDDGATRQEEPAFRSGAFASDGDPDELLRFGRVRIPRRLVQTILRAADATGVDPTYMMALADKESSFIADNKAATSSAEGLFQFIEKTWLEMIRDFGPKYGMEFAAASVETANGQVAIPSEQTR
ncbi:MAG: transglycosylase SLT domain-containing protein [Microvirga sp.]